MAKKQTATETMLATMEARQRAERRGEQAIELMAGVPFLIRQANLSRAKRIAKMVAEENVTIYEADIALKNNDTEKQLLELAATLESYLRNDA